MATEYAELPLLQPIQTDKGEADTLIVTRPTSGVMMKTLDAPNARQRIATFVEGCCYARVNGDARVKFESSSLNAADAGEIASVVSAMSGDADGIEVPDAETADGIGEPIVYTLQFPLHLAKKDDGSEEKVLQLEFRARTLGEISRYLDAQGTGAEFREFMRAFGTLLGTRLPMTDTIIDAFDFIDFLVVRNKIMGKLVRSRGRWKRTST